MTGEERFLKTLYSELIQTKELYESIIGMAARGLFYRTGQIMGKRIANEANQERNRYFEKASELLKKEGWVEDIELKANEIVVKGAIETKKSSSNTCDMLRGVLSTLYEEYQGKRVFCREIECESTGSENCVFRVGN